MTINQLDKFGHLTALSVTKVGRRHVWACQCECGAITSVRSDNLTSGRTTSCGCQKNRTVGRRNQMSPWTAAQAQWRVEIWQTAIEEDVPGTKTRKSFAVVHKISTEGWSEDEEPFWLTSKVSPSVVRKGPLGAYQEQVLHRMAKASMIKPKGSRSAKQWAEQEGVTIGTPKQVGRGEVYAMHDKLSQHAAKTGNGFFI